MVGGAADAVAIVMTYGAQSGVQADFAGTSMGGSTSTSGDLVVGRFSSTGNVEWARRYGGAGEQNGLAITALGDDTLAVGGNFTASFSMDTQTLTFSGSFSDSFFAVLDGASNPSVTWAFKVGSASFDAARSVAGRGKVLYGTGVFEGTGTFLGRTLDHAGAGDAYLFAGLVP
jgi:hypothetical protein